MWRLQDKKWQITTLEQNETGEWDGPSVFCLKAKLLLKMYEQIRLMIHLKGRDHQIKISHLLLHSPDVHCSLANARIWELSLASYLHGRTHELELLSAVTQGRHQQEARIRGGVQTLSQALVQGAFTSMPITRWQRTILKNTLYLKLEQKAVEEFDNMIEESGYK